MYNSTKTRRVGNPAVAALTAELLRNIGSAMDDTTAAKRMKDDAGLRRAEAQSEDGGLRGAGCRR